jgi:hypothetical protein
MIPAQQSQDQIRLIERTRPALHPSASTPSAMPAPRGTGPAPAAMAAGLPHPRFAPSAAPAAPRRLAYGETVVLATQTPYAWRCARSTPAVGRTGARHGR